MLGLHCFYLILMSSLVSLFSFVFSWLLSSIYMFYCLAFWREAVVSTSWFSFFCGWRFEFCSSVVHVCFCQFFVVWWFWCLHVYVLLARVLCCFFIINKFLFFFSLASICLLFVGLHLHGFGLIILFL